jgi:quercetin dioxygenase-like cupin family protein
MTETEHPYPGIERLTLNTERATVNEYRFGPHARFPTHHHPQEQLTVVLEGTVFFEADGQTIELKAGQWNVTRGGVVHGIHTGDGPARFLAIVMPGRPPGEHPILSNDTGAH